MQEMPFQRPKFKNGISNLYILLKSALKMQEMPFQRPKFQKISWVECPRTPYNSVVTMASPSLKSWLSHWMLVSLVFNSLVIFFYAGWSMQDNQGGDLFWRRGLIKLTKFRKLTQVFFKFALSLKPENHKSASNDNVSLNNVKLECESVKKKTVDTGVCQKRKIHSVGCIHRANEPTTKG